MLWKVSDWIRLSSRQTKPAEKLPICRGRAAITETTILVPYLEVQSPQLIWRSGILRFHLRVPDLQMSCRLRLNYVTRYQDSSCPVMTARRYAQFLVYFLSTFCMRDWSCDLVGGGQKLVWALNLKFWSLHEKCIFQCMDKILLWAFKSTLEIPRQLSYPYI